ncbi:MAG: L-lactate dehydrogenase [Eggerthellaceae bacterium]|nr:L-lactate dehydrogenase [Eggerthellaceae bacterium]
MGQVNLRKAAIIGCGFVGASSAFALMQSGLFSELVLLDAVREKAEGEALDISHGLPFARPMDIYAGDYADIEDAAVIVVTAGAAQKPGETRLDLVKKNVAIFKSIMAQIEPLDCQGVMVVVANPVDILTQVAIRYSGMPESRVIGSGTVLDTARLKYLLGANLDVDSRSVHAYIIGEHGDSEIPAWSCATVSGVSLLDFFELRGYHEPRYIMDQVADDVKNSAYEIIEKKHATYYGVAMGVKRICEAIIRDEKSILPVSVMLHGQFGIDGVVLSMPAVLGKNGMEGLVPLRLSNEEQESLRASANTLKEIADAEI